MIYWRKIQSVKSFKKDCITFISSMLTKLLERSPLIYAVVWNSSSISPLLIATDPDRSKTYFKNFLERIVQINRIKTNDADKAQADFTKFHSSITLQNLTRFKNFDKLWGHCFKGFSGIWECCCVDFVSGSRASWCWKGFQIYQ